MEMINYVEEKISIYHILIYLIEFILFRNHIFVKKIVYIISYFS